MKTLKYLIIVSWVMLGQVFYSCSETNDQNIPAKVELPTKGLCAHRGAMSTHPENTIPAFQEAIRLGAHMIEFDVRFSKDNKLVILHDAYVDRTTSGTGKISDLTLSEIKQLDAGSWKDLKFKNVKIPTLDETLAIMPENIWLNIHIKGGAELGKEIAKTLIKKNRVCQSFIACSYDAATAAKLVSNEIKICNMERQEYRDEYIKATKNNKCEFIQLLSKRESTELLDEVKMLKDNGIKINYYKADKKEEVKYLLEKGIDFILVNDLAPMLDYTDKLGIKRTNK